MAELHDTTEEYLQTILHIEEEGATPIRARLVERLGLAAPTVSETVHRLAERGYVEVLDDRSLRLTTEGREIAVATVRRHRLAERLLVDVIGLEWEKVHREAARWEHVISSDVEEKLIALLGDPATCPHGNPIPGSHHAAPAGTGVRLVDCELGPVMVRRLDEQLEHDDAGLALVASSALTPGEAATVVITEGGITVETASGRHVVPDEVARHLWVVPA
jgi:DtxR family transcriptional regulator, iron-dependent repressor